MSTFTIGEEVIYDEERYVIASKSDQKPLRYRLLATTPKGARMLWVDPKDLEKIVRYTKPFDDTALY